jgi:hypothetical protein
VKKHGRSDRAYACLPASVVVHILDVGFFSFYNGGASQEAIAGWMLKRT